MQPSPFTARADLGLAWSVKDSFLQYIRGMNDGAIRWGGGAAVASTGQFYFPLEDASRIEGALVLSFAGEVRFTAHRGVLSVTISDPLIRIVGGEGALSVRWGEKEELITKLDLPPLIIDNDVAMWLDTVARLAGSGPDLFGGTYPEDEQLAPLTIRVPATMVKDGDQ
ncbi:HtaA domain-containing protein [Herbiconiux sp. YIM B11900]|uniref:HtaA domain-containing protein n=1 Tax=Herbiconiux sp. YIM B11900 TaxID=3404131 RepID=UPI003F86D9A5